MPSRGCPSGPVGRAETLPASPVSGRPALTDGVPRGGGGGGREKEKGGGGEGGRGGEGGGGRGGEGEGGEEGRSSRTRGGCP